MAPKKENTKQPDKVEEPIADYSVPCSQNEREVPFDFDAEFEKGYTLEEFRAEMHKRIKAYPWKK